MKLAGLRAAALAVLLAAALAGAQEKHDVPTFASKVELVTVDAVVVDGKGQPVRGLKAADFTLTEDGKPQAIASFEAFDLGDAPEWAVAVAPASPVATNQRPVRAGARSFVLLVDDMGLAPTRQEVVRSAIARFLEVGLRDGDELIFATTSGDAWWSAGMPEGREDVAALAARVRGRSLVDRGSDTISEWEAFRINSAESATGAEGASTGASAQSQGPPTGAQPPTTLAPGANITERVVQRYLARGLCDPSALWMCPPLVHARAQDVDLRRVNRTRDALAAVDRAVFALTGVRGRKSLIFLTEGFLNDSNLGLVQEVAGRCREANLVVYSLDVRGLMTGLPGADEPFAPNTAELALMQLEQTDLVAAGSVGLAEDTGGFAVRNTNDLAEGAARVADESRTYYLLGYAPPEGKGPRDWRKLKVEVKTRGLEVRARRGYTLRTSAEIAAAADAARRPKAGKDNGKDNKDKANQPAEGAAPDTRRLPTDMARALATAHDADAIPLRAMPYSLDDRPSGAVRTLLAVEADMRSLANLGGEEHPHMVLSLSISATHRDSGKTQRLDQRIQVDSASLKAWEGWLALSREFDLPPGVAQARVVVRDEFLGRLGALTVRFVVPPSGGLRVSTPVLTDRLSTPAKDKPAYPAIVAHRDFAAGQVYCQFQVFGAKATSQGVLASYELRHRNGDAVRQGPATPITPSPDGRLVRLLALGLDNLAPGDYELVLRIEDKTTGETRERVEPLRITARS
jgi:VWFA-related protein